LRNNLSGGEVLEEFLSDALVIEKQPSAIVKRNIEKYAAPAAVLQEGFLPFDQE